MEILGLSLAPQRLLGFAFASADLLLELAPDGRIALAIGASEALSGSAETDLVGRAWRDFIDPRDRMMVAALLGSLPKAEWLLADRGYDADWFREALKDKGIKPCIPGRKSRGKPIKHDRRRYKRRNRIEIMFGRLKDWRRVVTRYDRSPKVFLSVVALAATVIFWL